MLQVSLWTRIVTLIILVGGILLALPNASFMGFTGTPLVVGEELTKQQFGDYVSVYNFRAAIEDGSTVPVHPGFSATVDDFGNLLVRRTEETS